MANKYQMRRRALKDTTGRGENTERPTRRGGRDDAQPGQDYTPPPRMDRRGLTFVLCLVLVVLIAALFVQTGRHKFTVCDDNEYIYKNHNIWPGLTWSGVHWAFGDSHAGNWHPLTWMSHMLDWQVFGADTWEPENNRYKSSWPGGHHLVNVALHCANAVLLFLALRMLTGTLWPSFVVAVLFAAHPLRAESVAWAAERKDVLCGLFWMAAMLFYARYAKRPPIHKTSFLASAVLAIVLGVVFGRLVLWPDPSDKTPVALIALGGVIFAGLVVFAASSLSWRTQLGEIGGYTLVTVCLCLGLTAKSMIVTLPCIFLLLDIWPLGRWQKALWPPGREAGGPDYLRGLWLLVEKLPWFGLVAGDCFIAIYGQNKGVALNSLEGLPMGVRILNAVESCGEYLRQTLLPTGMAPFYPHPHMIPDGWTTEFWTKFWIYSVLMSAVTVAALWFFKKRAFLIVGWLWFLGALMPVNGIMQVGTQARADRYTYLPMIGVYLMVAWLLKEVADRWPQRRPLLAIGGAIVLAAMCAATFRQVSYWSDSYNLFFHSIGVKESDYFGYDENKKVDLAKAKAVANVEKNYFAFNHIGIAYDEDAQRIIETDRIAAMDKFDRSAAAFAATIGIKPDYDFGNNNLGVYFARHYGLEDLVLAEGFFRAALRSNARYGDAYNNLGIILMRQGELLVTQGKYDEALVKLTESAQIHHIGMQSRGDQKPSDHNNLCRVYLQISHVHRALAEKADKAHETDKAAKERQLQTQSLLDALKVNQGALALDENFIDSWMSRAEIYHDQDVPDMEIESLERVIKIDPTTVQTSHALGKLLMRYGQDKNQEKALACLANAGDRFIKFVSGKPFSLELLRTPFSLGFAYQSLRQSEKALEWFDRTHEYLKLAVAAKPNLPELIPYQFQLAAAFVELKQPDKAIGLLSQIPASDRLGPDFYNVRGVADLMLGNLAAAKSDFERLLQLAPQYPGGRERLNEVNAKLARP